MSVVMQSYGRYSRIYIRKVQTKKVISWLVQDLRYDIQLYKYINAQEPLMRLVFDPPSIGSYNDGFPEPRAILAFFEANLVISQSK